MYAVGDGIDILRYQKIPFSNPSPVYRLHGKEHRDGYAEMFDSDTGEVLFSQGSTIALIGQYSRISRRNPSRLLPGPLWQQVLQRRHL